MSHERKPAAELEPTATASETSPSELQPQPPEKARGGMSRREFARRAAMASAIGPIAAWAPAPAATPATPQSPAATPPAQTAQAANLP